jgi:putative endonuclease
MFYIYILYSESANKYYIGYTNDTVRRLIEHNTTDEIKFTTKYRPWKMLVSLEVSYSRGDAMIMERFIKRQKSRKFLSGLIAEKENPDYFKNLMKNVLG